MRGTDVGISKKKMFPFFTAHYARKKREKRIFFLQSAPFCQFSEIYYIPTSVHRQLNYE